MLPEIIGVFLMAFGRSFTGWFEKNAKDGITKYEWILLASTTLRVALFTAMTYYGLGSFGFDPDIVSSGAAAIILDVLKPKSK